MFLHANLLNIRLFLALLVCVATQRVSAQNIGINANGAVPNASALLDVDASALPANDKRGLLIPRVALTSTTSSAPVVSPAASLLVYNTATAGSPPTGVSPGFYYWAGSAWVRVATTGDTWQGTGNSGTVPGVNFVGTTDARDLVFKTAGGSAVHERMRILGDGATPGQVVLNNTGIRSGDVFSVYASNTTNGGSASISNVIGTSAINGYSAGNGVGVLGDVNGGAAGAGTGVLGTFHGTATAISSTSQGVLGKNATAPAGAGPNAAVASGVRGEASGSAGAALTMGVLGVNTAVAGAAHGSYGQTDSPSGTGVFGINMSMTINPAHGVQGQTAATGSGAGVRGFNTANAIPSGQNAFGVRGSVNGTPSGSGFVQGVRGDASATTGATYGVHGQVASASGFGVNAVNTNASGTGLLVTGQNVASTLLNNGSGAAVNGASVGLFAIGKSAASGVGVLAVGNNLTNNLSTPSSGCGLAATGSQYGVMGFASTAVNTSGSSTASTNGSDASAGGYFEVASSGVPQTWSYVGVRDNGGVLRKIIGPGTVNTVVTDLQGNRVALSAPEAPENLFMDYGSGRLVDGRAHVHIDPVLSRNITVNEQHPLRVFVQIEGDCRGVFVTNKSANGFDVVELDGGASDVPFSYTVVANRADEVNPDGTLAAYSAERFPAAPGPQARTPLRVGQADPAVLKVAGEEPLMPPGVLQRAAGVAGE